MNEEKICRAPGAMKEDSFKLEADLRLKSLRRRSSRKFFLKRNNLHSHWKFTLIMPFLKGFSRKIRILVHHYNLRTVF